MGHYSDLYEAETERREKEREKELKRLKTKFPHDPSQWNLALEERVKLLEQRIFELEKLVR